MTNHSKQIISLTDQAADHIKKLISERDKECVGIRVGVKSGGCSGLAYTFEYAENKEPTDDVVIEKGVTLLVDVRASLYLIGTQLDYIDEKVRSGFIFINPNSKGECGCGESFHT